VEDVLHVIGIGAGGDFVEEIAIGKGECVVADLAARTPPLHSCCRGRNCDGYDSDDSCDAGNLSLASR